MFNSWGLVNAYGTWSSYYVGHSLRGTDQLELNLIGSTQSFIVLLLISHYYKYDDFFLH